MTIANMQVIQAVTVSYNTIMLLLSFEFFCYDVQCERLASVSCFKII